MFFPVVLFKKDSNSTKRSVKGKRGEAGRFDPKLHETSVLHWTPPFLNQVSFIQGSSLLTFKSYMLQMWHWFYIYIHIKMYIFFWFLRMICEIDFLQRLHSASCFPPLKKTHRGDSLLDCVRLRSTWLWMKSKLHAFPYPRRCALNMEDLGVLVCHHTDMQT